MLELARRSAFLMVMAEKEQEKEAADLDARTLPGEFVNLPASLTDDSKPNGHESTPDVNLHRE